MYETYFGFKAKPFTIAPNPAYLYMSHQHHEALAHLFFGVQSDNGFIVITGEVGTGKTTLCRCFLDQVPEKTEVCLVLNPRMNAIEMLASICDELKITHPKSETSAKIYVDLINKRLLENHAQGMRTLLIVDEAQNLSDSVLEQLRLLTNLETNDRKLLQIVLIGQTELRERFEKRNLRQLAQRVTARYHLVSLTEKDVAEYIRHRLIVAGGRSGIFSDSAIKKIFFYSKGVPRIINSLCDRALLGAYAGNEWIIDGKIVKKAAQELLGIKRTNTVKILIKITTSLLGLLFLAVIIYSGMKIYEPIKEKLKTKWQLYSPQIIKEKTALQEVKKPIAVISSPLPADLSGKENNALSQPLPSEIIQSTLPILEKPAINPVINSAINSSAIEETAPSKEKKFSHNFYKIFESTNISESSSSEAAWQSLFMQWGSPAINTHALEEGNLLLSDASSLSQSRADFGYFAESEAWQMRCLSAQTAGLTCLSRQGDLNILAIFNMPIVMKLVNVDKTSFGSRTRYALLNGLSHTHVRLIIEGQEYLVPIRELQRYWTRDYLLLWKMPADFKGTLSPGAKGKMVVWLEAQLAQWDGGQANHGANLGPNQAIESEVATYDQPLVERVKAFQASVGLEPDGMVGINTFILLSLRGDKTAPTISE